MEKITQLTLEEQRSSFSKRRFLAMPLAGTIVWIAIGISGLFLSAEQTVGILFGGTGSIVYLGMLLSKFTGENFLKKSKPKNTFDSLFFMAVAMSLAVYAIAIPFFIIDYSSLPLSVGILSGLMWMPVSWMIQHWIGIFHTLARTATVTVAWFVFPQDRFVVIPFIIVGIYVITIFVLERRWREVNNDKAMLSVG